MLGIIFSIAEHCRRIACITAQDATGSKSSIFTSCQCSPLYSALSMIILSVLISLLVTLTEQTPAQVVDSGGGFEDDLWLR